MVDIHEGLGPRPYPGHGVHESFTDVEDIGCQVEDGEVELCAVRSGDEIYEVDVDRVHAHEVESTFVPHMNGTYEGFEYQMMTDDRDYHIDRIDTWMDATDMGAHAPTNCVIGSSEETGTTMVCGNEGVPFWATVDPSGTQRSGGNPMSNPEKFQTR